MKIKLDEAVLIVVPTLCIYGDDGLETVRHTERTRSYFPADPDTPCPCQCLPHRPTSFIVCRSEFYFTRCPLFIL